MEPKNVSQVSSQQRPSVGRIVHFRSEGTDAGPRLHAALVVSVHDDGSVNLVRWDEGGVQHLETRVTEGDGVNSWSWPARV